MKRPLHDWNLSPKQAVQLQRELAPLVLPRDDFKEVHCVAGVGMAIHESKQVAYAGVILFEFPSLREIERVDALAPLKFPYVPGLLSFREIPILLQAIHKLRRRPDLLFVDGHGLAHPRRFGIASHLGLWLDLPTVGCAKSRLCGEYRQPAQKRGSFSPLLDGEEEVGRVLRTRDGVRPIFVSVGHRIGLRSAVRVTLDCHAGWRIPKPTREADLYVAELKRLGG